MMPINVPKVKQTTLTVSKKSVHLMSWAMMSMTGVG